MSGSTGSCASTPAAGFILYVEIPARGGVLRAPNSQVGVLKR
jgi:hypothetical protein